MAIPPGTATRARAAFAHLRDSTSADEFVERLFSAPVLLRHDIVAWLNEQLSTADDERGIAFLFKANEIRMTLSPADYPLGPGPVERIWARVSDGDISLVQAFDAVRTVQV